MIALLNKDEEVANAVIQHTRGLIFPATSPNPDTETHEILDSSIPEERQLAPAQGSAPFVELRDRSYVARHVKDVKDASENRIPIVLESYPSI